jgi:holo-[acyl-carrier protein] synthase
VSRGLAAGIEHASILGVGVDAVGIARFQRVLERTPTIVERVFTADEREYADSARLGVQRYAVRFAAKEAVLKAMRAGIFTFPLTQIEIVRGEGGAPFVHLHGRARALAEERYIGGWQLTMTHTDEVAEAVVLALRDPGAPSLRFELFPEDMDTTVSFYEDVLGFELERREEAYAHLRLGSVQLGLVPAAVLPVGNPPKPLRGEPRGRGIEVVIEVPDLAAAHARVRSVGVPVDDPVEQPWGLRDFRLLDPDGVYLRVTSR